MVIYIVVAVLTVFIVVSFVFHIIVNSLLSTHDFICSAYAIIFAILYMLFVVLIITILMRWLYEWYLRRCNVQ